MLFSVLVFGIRSLLETLYRLYACTVANGFPWLMLCDTLGAFSCSKVSRRGIKEIVTYLTTAQTLPPIFPGVRSVLTTGHVD